MSDNVTQLFPCAGESAPLQGLYLKQAIRAPATETPFIYSNFVTSLDGRIALAVTGRDSHQVPGTIANHRDWRLYQELAAQADLLITSARYFRQSVHGESQDNLPVGPGSAFDDLLQWRRDRQLPEQPAIAVFSASLDIPAAALRPYEDRRIHVLTGELADPDARRRLADETHAEIIACGTGSGVDGARVRETLGGLGYHYIYAVAGSSVLHTLAAGGALDRLYLTFANRLLGGTEFDTLSWGAELAPAMNLPLRSLYLDTAMPEGAGQLFASFGS